MKLLALEKKHLFPYVIEEDLYPNLSINYW